MDKKGYFFSLDALIALLLVVAVILLFDFVPEQVIHYTYVQEDVLKVLSDLKVGETNNSYVKALIASGKIKNLNNSILEQIGEFYAQEDPDAVNLALEFLNPMEHENVGLWFNDEMITSKNSTSYNASKQIWVSRQVISGIQKGSNITGYSSRAYLTKNSLMKYYYFGGYVGDGNITAIIEYNGTIKGASIEVAVNNNFSLYINNIYVGNYQRGSSSYEPLSINLTSHLSKFNSGSNMIEFRNGQFYMAGGYIVIDYETDVIYQVPAKYSFPGINGVINLYDSFYIPGTLNNMEVYLHYYMTNNTVYLTIGNVTVYNSSANGEINITLTDLQLDPQLDYTALSNKTIPLRFGLENMSLSVSAGNADVILTTDLSDSMDFRLDNDSIGVARNCTDPGIYNDSTKRISLAKCLDREVIDSILNVSGNRVALVGFYGDASAPRKARVYEHNFTSNKNVLYAEINNYTLSGGTCICCAINDAWALFSEGSNSSRKRFVILMSDGIPTHSCEASNGCYGTRTGRPSEEGLWLGWGAGCYGDRDDCEVNDCVCAAQNANWSSCRLNNDHNATVYSIGYGGVGTCTMANNTLNDVAKCGKGRYSSSNNAITLREIYANISREIMGLSYTEQIVVSRGEATYSKLYPDSYIKFNHSRKDTPYGIAISYRTDKFNNNISQGSFSVPINSTAVDVNVLSYSGSKWSDSVELQNSSWRFKLSDYGADYGWLGDPFVINVPEQYVKAGNNTVIVKVGSSPTTPFGGSPYNRITYTIVKSLLAYSPILPVAVGCSWNVSYEDGSSEIINVPKTYSGARVCTFKPGSISYNTNDAIDVAVYNLFRILDADSNDMIDFKLSQQSLEVSSVEVQGIPFIWSSEVQVRAWR